MKRMISTFWAIAMVLSFACMAQATAFNAQWAIGAGQASALESTFLSSGVFTTEGFEGLETGTTGTFKVGFGTIFSSGYVSDNKGLQVGTGEYAVEGSHFFSDGDLKGLQPKHDIAMTFNAPATKVGFYATDLMDIGGKVILSFGNSQTGDSASFNLFDMLGALKSGSLVYFALSSTIPFDSMLFATSAGDGFGIDNVSVGTSPTPVPGALWLLGSGLIGLVGVRRVASVRKV